MKHKNRIPSITKEGMDRKERKHVHRQRKHTRRIKEFKMVEPLPSKNSWKGRGNKTVRKDDSLQARARKRRL